MRITARFHERILARERLAGTFLNLGSPLVAEIAGCAGFDWLPIDLEHGVGGEESLLSQLHAAGTTPAAPVVRIAANEVARFKRALDLGASGVMVPWVNSANEARAAVAAFRYPPRGVRGVTKFMRACEFGADFNEYFVRANDRLVLMTQIETADAVENIEEIAAVEGIDVLFIGPMDLTTCLGIQGQFEHPRFRDAVAKTCETAARAGKATGILSLNPALLPLCDEFGITVIALGADDGAVNAAMHASAAAIRKGTTRD